MQAPVKRPRGRPRKSPTPQQQVAESEKPAEASVRPLSTPAAANTPLKVHIYPKFKEDDIGGIARVVEAQHKHLPKFGVEVVEDPEDADVIVAHAIVPSSYVKRFPRKTLISICHGLYWSEYEWHKNVLKINEDVIECIRVADRTITCSEWVANAIRRATSRQVDIVNHGIDLEDWKGYNTQDYVLWNKTRPDPVCDPEPLNQLAQAMPKQKFVSTFGNMQLPNVAITGTLPYRDAKALIAQAGVYLCTARETFGIGTLEAMACGVPVVGFDFGGQSEFIEHKVDGWLAPPGDIASLVEGINWAFENREEVSIAARNKIERLFTWEAQVERYADIFKEVHERKSVEAPRTSIIVTAYKLEKYLPDTLESIRNQTDKDWECIIVDDASPDDCGKIADEYASKDSRFKVIHNEKNSYLAESRNIGIRVARGRYILPLDADDMFTPSTVQVLADALDNDRTISVAYGGVYFVDEDGKTPTDYSDYYGKNNPHPPGHSSWPFQFSHEQQIKQQNLLPYASMFRRDAWEDVGGYRRRCRTAEDADMWTRLSSYGFRPKMVTKADTLIYRNRPDSMSRKEGGIDWVKWFIWAEHPELTPAGAGTKEQLPVPSYDPVIISVIIPVGPGHDKIVTDAIDSVDGQTFRNWECIVINDTGKPLETELPQWVRVINLDGNWGVAKARNVGIKASRGKLFLPLDADDYLEPEALSAMFYGYQKNKNVIYSDFWQTDMNGNVTDFHECDDYDPRLLTGGKRTVNNQVREGMLHAVTALTPKAYWEAVGGYDETLPAWEDWDFQLLLADKGFCEERIPIPLFTYRKHTGFRREENQVFFDKSKEGILRKWGTLWSGGKELMACSSCGGGKGRVPVTAAPRTANPARRAGQEEALLVKYIGAKQGSMPYRGASGTMYWFSANEGAKYVLTKDIDTFRRYPHDFEIMQPAPAPVASSEPKPEFVASGPPKE